MNHWIVGALLALLGGVGIALLNYALSGRVIRKKPAAYASFGMVRQLIHAAYLLALFCLAPLTPWELLPLLVGGALGMTLPLLALSPRLARQMQAALESEGGQPPAQNGPAAAAGKGEEPSPPAAPAGDAPPGQDMPGEETGSEVRKDG